MHIEHHETGQPSKNKKSNNEIRFVVGLHSHLGVENDSVLDHANCGIKSCALSLHRINMKSERATDTRYGLCQWTVGVIASSLQLQKTHPVLLLDSKNLLHEVDAELKSHLDFSTSHFKPSRKYKE